MRPVSTLGRKLGRALRSATHYAAAFVLLTGQLGPAYAAIDNTAVAVGNYAGTGAITSLPSTQSVTVLPATPGLMLLKQPGSIADTNANGVTDAGDTINWSFSVTNTGNVTLANVTVSDPGATVTGGPVASLIPGATDAVTFTASRLLVQADLDAGGVQNSATATASSSGLTNNVTVVSDAGDPLVETPDLNGVTDGNPANDPTVTLIGQAPSFTVAKTPVTTTFSAVGDVVEFAVTVTNTGTVTLSSVTPVDALADTLTCAAGLPIPAIAPGASETCTANHIIDAAHLQAGAISDTVSVTAVTPTGTTMPGQTATATISLTGTDISTVKTILSGGTTVAEDETVTYQIVVTNNGPNTADNLSLTDLLPAALAPVPANGTVTQGSYAPATGLWSIGALASGQTATLTLQGVVNSGTAAQTISNTTTPATSPTTPDTGLTPDALTVDVTVDTHIVIATDDPLGDVSTPVYLDPIVSGLPLPAQINLGTVLGNDSIGGNIPFLPGTYLISVPSPIPGSPINIAADGTISVLTSTPAGAYTQNYTLCEAANPWNCATAVVSLELVAPGIAAADDTVTGNQNGTTGVPAVVNVLDNDSLGGNTPVATNVSLTATGGTGASYLTLNPDGTIDLAPGTPAGTYTLTYDICDVVNPASCASATVTVPVHIPATVSGYVYEDDNGNGFFDGPDTPIGGYIVELVLNGSVIGSAVTNPDGSYQIPNVAAGIDYQIVFRDPGGTIVGGIPNINLNPGDNLIDQNLPIDPSGVIYDAVTGLPVAGATVTMTNGAGVPLPAVCFVDPTQQGQMTAADGGYRFDIVPNADPACPATETQYDLVVVPPTGYLAPPSGALAPLPGPADVTACAFDAVPGGACQPAAVSQPPAGPAVLPYVLSFLIAAGDPDVIHNHIPLDPFGVGTGVQLTKIAETKTIRRGETVEFTIRAENPATSAVGLVRITDRIPAGFVYVAGTATVNGAPVTPTQTGTLLDFGTHLLAAQSSVIVRLTLRANAAAQPGEHVNLAYIENNTGTPLAPRARAVVTILPEAVFDCSDVIGKVFDDKNGNGYQDKGEPGLAGVRVATVRGLLITTDQFGRFHVPCAELPDQETGSNFILKLDTRTLPTGYRLTTENPRVMRLTAGKMVEMNFGASLGREVRLDLKDAAFLPGSAELAPTWKDGLGKLVGILEERWSHLLVVYISAEDRALMGDRLDGVEAEIRKLWKARGEPYELHIEIRTKRSQ